MLRTALLATALTVSLGACATSSGALNEATEAVGGVVDGAVAEARLAAAVSGAWRNPDNVARDGYRHPRETLQFFGVMPDDTVIEITPGGGWYAEILAPYLREDGQYVAAVVDPMALPEGRGRDYQANSKAGLETLFAGSADAVLTFRNVHNWRSNGQAEGMFQGFFDVLKPGGVLGVVEHRAAADVPADDRSGYVGQAQVVAMAQAAGFVLDASSEVNANPRDTKDHPNGVWTLPPGNRHEDTDRAKYQAIGESDRMTLRFRKPG